MDQLGTNAPYSFEGNRIAISGEISAPRTEPSTTVYTTFNLDISITGSQIWPIAGNVIFNGTIDLGPYTLELQPFQHDGRGGYVRLARPLTGSGGLTQGGFGVVDMEAANTYTGPTTVGDTSLMECLGCTIAGPVTVEAGQLFLEPGTGGNTPIIGPLTSLGAQIIVYGPGARAGGLSLDAATLYIAGGSSPTNQGTLSVTGTVSLGGAKMKFSPAPTVGGFLTVIDNDGTDAIAGTFADLPEGATASCSCGPPNGSGTISYHGGTGNDVIITGPAATSTTLTSAPNPSTPGQSVLLTATVAASSGSPSGTVIFYDGTTVMGSQPLASGTAAMTTSSLAPGSHNLTAAFNPSTSAFSASTSPVYVHTVNPIATSTSLDASPNPTFVGQTTTLTATVTSSSDAPTGRVTFYDGTTPLATGIIARGRVTVSVGPLAQGGYTLSATFVPDTAAFAGSTSSPLGLVVTAAATVTVTLDVSPLSVRIGQIVTLSATVSSASGTPSGTVTFYDGDTALGAESAGSSTVSITATLLGAGEHHLVARFTPASPAFAPGSSGVVILTVVSPPARRRAVSP